MANHPVLSLDPDLKLFLSSDAFSVDVSGLAWEHIVTKTYKRPTLGKTQAAGDDSGEAKCTSIHRRVDRRTEIHWRWWCKSCHVHLRQHDKSLKKISFRDQWFDKQKILLDSLESQIKALSKCLELASRQRSDLASNFSVLSDTIQALAESELSLALSQLLHRFAALSSKEREKHDDQAKLDVVRLLNLADEHLRQIGSVRVSVYIRSAEIEIGTDKLYALIVCFCFTDKILLWLAKCWSRSSTREDPIWTRANQKWR